MFQSWIGTAPYLGYVANYTFYYNSPAPPVSTNLLNLFIYSLYPTASQSVAFFLVAPISCTSYPHPILSQSAFHLDVTHTHHPSSSASCICALHRVTASVPCHVNVISPLFCPWPALRSLSAPGGLSHHGYLLVSLTLLHTA